MFEPEFKLAVLFNHKYKYIIAYLEVEFHLSCCRVCLSLKRISLAGKNLRNFVWVLRGNPKIF